jgi:hypothetical protein
MDYRAAEGVEFPIMGPLIAGGIGAAIYQAVSAHAMSKPAVWLTDKVQYLSPPGFAYSLSK